MTSEEAPNSWIDLPAGLYRIRSWGDFSIEDLRTGAELKLRGRKARALLAFLAYHPDRPISRERLTGLLWGDRAEEQARASLRQALVELKKLSGDGPPVVRSDRMSVTANRSVLLTDVDELLQLAHKDEFDALLKALPEPAEQFLSNLDDVDASFNDWLKFERGSQREALARLAADAAKRAKAKGALAISRSLARRAASLDPQFGLTAIQPEPPSADSSARTERPGLTSGGTRRFNLVLATLVMLLVGAVTIYLVRDRFRNDAIRIAVLPFEDRSQGGNPYLADGIAEEIMAQLQLNPGHRVVGRTSAWSLRNQAYDAPTIGRKLSASHLVEGSVQSNGEKIRVDVSLVQANDGSRLWTQRFEGRLTDVLAMQERIGNEISQRLRTGGVSRTAANVNVESYGLYLVAKGLIRTREQAKLEAATELLRQALKIDPKFASAWATLGQAELYLYRQSMPDAAFNPRAPEAIVSDIRRALALQPDLAEAHLAMGLAAGPGTERRHHLSHAAKLNPNDAEIWNALAQDYRFHGQYGRELDAWRRAVEIEPLWHRAFFNAAEAAWNMQSRDEADRYSNKAAADAPPQPFTSYMVRSDQAMRRADFSASLLAARQAHRAGPEGRRMYAELARSRASRAMGNFPEAVQGWPYYPVDDVMLGMWNNRAPGAVHVHSVIAHPTSIRSDEARISFYLGTLLNAGRAQEAVGLFEARYGSPSGLAKQQPFGHAGFIRHAILGEIAYAKTGRKSEAMQLLRLATGAVREVMVRGPQPNWYQALVAQLWAVSGNRNAALDALENAERLGWYYGKERDSFADLALEPAFAPIVAEPRFQAVRSRFLRLAQRERAEARNLN